jgi:hypothetical protein
MQRREYMTRFVESNRWSDSMGRTGTVPLGKNMGVRASDPTALLNGLGEQSWELAGVACRDGDSVFRLFLKRPKP